MVCSYRYLLFTVINHLGDETMKHAAILTALIFAVCILITTGCSLIPQNVALNSAQPQYSSTTYDEKNPGHPDFIEPVISDNWFIVEHVGRDLDIVQPMGVAYCNGKIFVCDTPENKIKVFDTEFNFLYSIGSLGNEVGSFLNPSDIGFRKQSPSNPGIRWNTSFF